VGPQNCMRLSVGENRMKFINANKLHRKSGHLAIFVRPQ